MKDFDRDFFKNRAARQPMNGKAQATMKIAVSNGGSPSSIRPSFRKSADGRSILITAPSGMNILNNGEVRPTWRGHRVFPDLACGLFSTMRPKGPIYRLDRNTSNVLLRRAKAGPRPAEGRFATPHLQGRAKRNAARRHVRCIRLPRRYRFGISG